MHGNLYRYPTQCLDVTKKCVEIVLKREYMHLFSVILKVTQQELRVFCVKTNLKKVRLPCNLSLACHD